MACSEVGGTQFNNLILLIGTNPLPNFVVTEYFIKNNLSLKNIWLVYSEKINFQEGTYIYAENLSKSLKVRHPNNPVTFNYIPLSDISNANRISSQIKELLISKLDEKSTVHLNYTGGTKVMGTHVYLTIKLDTTKRLEKSFSYLDSRSFRIVYDKNDVVTKDLREEVSLTFDELIKLHGFERKNKDSDVDFSKAIDEFQKLIKNKTLARYYDKNGGYNRTMFEVRDNNNRLKLADKLREVDQNKINKFNPNEEFRNILLALPDDYKMYKENKFIENSKFTKTIKFLDGVWLEEYIYRILKENINGTNIEILKNWEIKKRRMESMFST
jgi:hypothetical protein